MCISPLPILSGGGEAAPQAPAEYPAEPGRNVLFADNPADERVGLAGQEPIAEETQEDADAEMMQPRPCGRRTNQRKQRGKSMMPAGTWSIATGAECA